MAQTDCDKKDKQKKIRNGNGFPYPISRHHSQGQRADNAAQAELKAVQQKASRIEKLLDEGPKKE